MSHHIHVIDLLTQELKMVNIEQKQMVGDVIDVIADQEIAFASLQITIDSIHTDILTQWKNTKKDQVNKF